MSTVHPSQALPQGAPAAAGATCCGHHDAFEILHDCHEHIGERLARLDALAREVGRDGVLGEKQLANLCELLAFFDTAIPVHSADEEQTLFPRLREALGDCSGGTPMDCMEHEHVQHQAMMRRLKQAVVQRDVTGLARAAAAIVAAYRDHIGKEESILYPMARELLTERPVIDAMTGEMRARRAALGLGGC